MTPTERSMKLARERGYIVEKVERIVPYHYTRQDCFGFGDLLIAGNGVIALVQSTAGYGNARPREEKIRASENFPAWRAAGGKVFLWVWVKRGSPKRWSLHVDKEIK